jgi:hypothetical protein
MAAQRYQASFHFPYFFITADAEKIPGPHDGTGLVFQFTLEMAFDFDCQRFHCSCSVS